jgi:hypothetical protein
MKKERVGPKNEVHMEVDGDVTTCPLSDMDNRRTTQGNVELIQI